MNTINEWALKIVLYKLPSVFERSSTESITILYFPHSFEFSELHCCGNGLRDHVTAFVRFQYIVDSLQKCFKCSIYCIAIRVYCSAQTKACFWSGSLQKRKKFTRYSLDYSVCVAYHVILNYGPGGEYKVKSVRRLKLWMCVYIHLTGDVLNRTSNALCWGISNTIERKFLLFHTRTVDRSSSQSLRLKRFFGLLAVYTLMRV